MLVQNLLRNGFLVDKKKGKRRWQKRKKRKTARRRGYKKDYDIVTFVMKYLDDMQFLILDLTRFNHTHKHIPHTCPLLHTHAHPYTCVVAKCILYKSPINVLSVWVSLIRLRVHNSQLNYLNLISIQSSPKHLIVSFQIAP